MAAVIISEVNLIRDYVELTNNGSTKINLKDWKIIDTTPTNQKRHEFIFKKDFWLQSDVTVKIWSGAGRDDAENIYQNRRAPIWNNPGDTAELYDSAGKLIDELTIGAPPNKSEGGRGVRPPKPPIKPPQAKSKVYGYVTDSVCKQPITNAHLVFKEGQFSKSTDTNESGYYEINLPAGRYNTTVTAKNYDKIDGAIVGVQASSEVKKDFQMVPNLEIELGVDSTEVKFTRKDNKLIDAVQQLANKIIVDINTDYIFTVKLSVKKGMTDEIRATLLENGKNPNKRLNEITNKTCRISDDTKTLAIQFNPVKNKWAWYKFGWFRVAEKDITEKTFSYSVSLLGKYGNNRFDTKNPIPLGKITVKVNTDKADALFWYNVFLVVEGAVIIAAIIAAVLALLYAFPALVPALGITGSLSAATVASFIAAILGVLTEVPKGAKNEKLRAMDDPPKFDRNYRKLFIAQTNARTANVKTFSAVRNAIIMSRDRLYSAHVEKDKKTIKKQVKHIKKLLKVNELNIIRMVKQVQKASKLIRTNASLFDLHTTSKIRKALVAGKMPKKLLLKKLKKLQITVAQRRLAFDILKSKGIKNKDILILPKLKQFSSALLNSNKSFKESINKEIKWYSQI